MKAHVIENGVVINSIEVESLDFLSGLIDGSTGGIGWLWDGQTLTPPPVQTPMRTRADVLADLQTIDTRSIRALREGNATRIAELETQAQALRTELAAL